MMRKTLLLLIFWSLPLWGNAEVNSNKVVDADIIKAITQVIKSQESAWNRGDLEAYMQGYWHDEKMRFVTNSRFRFGWQETLALYKQHYPNAAALGQLLFTIENVQVISSEAAMVVGRWELERSKDNPQGVFTLLVELKQEQWVITHDHTSE